MHNIFIATSTFPVHSNEPIKMLESEDYEIVLNPLSLKLSTYELKEYAYDSFVH